MVFKPLQESMLLVINVLQTLAFMFEAFASLHIAYTYEVMRPLKPLINFCYKYFFNDRLLPLKIKFVFQQTNCCIIGFNTLAPSTIWSSNNLNEDHIIVATTKNKNKKQFEYDVQYKLQDIWATKYTWVENVVAKDGFICAMRCKVCTIIEHKDNIMIPKMDFLSKHAYR